MKNNYKILITFLLLIANTYSFAIRVEQIDPSRIELNKPLFDVDIAKQQSNPMSASQNKTLQGKKIKLLDVKINNAKKELIPATEKEIAKYLGKRITLADLSELVDNITNLYRNKGYVFSRAILPAQDVKDGKVEINMLHAHVSKYNVTGNVGYFNKAILDDMGQDITSNQDPHKIQDFERYVLVANEIGGVNAGFVLESANKQNLLNIKAEKKPVDASIVFDNNSTKSLGFRRMLATLRFNDAWLGGSLEGKYLASPDFKKLRYFNVVYSKVINAKGLSLQAQGSHSHTSPKLQSMSFDGESYRMELDLSYPLIYTRADKLKLTFGFHGVSTEIKQQSLSLFKDSNREVHLRLMWDKRDSLGLTVLEGELSQGFNALGAGNGKSTRAGSSLTFTKIFMNMLRVQYLTNRLSLILQSSSQFSLQPVSSIFEFGVGGMGYGQAYNTSELTGQNGVSWKGELKYYFDTLRNKVLDAFSVGVFYDGGMAYGKHKSLSSLHSAGLNMNIQLKKHLQTSLILACPLSRDNDGDSKTIRFLYQISLNI